MTASLAADYRLLIGGEWVRTDRTYDIANPATEDVIGSAPDATAADARSAAQAARAALESWAATPMAERCALLGRAADLYEKAMPELVPLAQAETGSTLAVTESMQVPITLQRLRRYSQPTEMDRPIMPAVMEATALGAGSVLSGLAVRQPVGVVACITSYNFPLTNLAGKIAPALAMGNTVVMKPAPQDPLCIIKLSEILADVFPPGVVNVVTGSGPDAGAALVESPDVDMVSFTGSTAVGTQIMAMGAATMKRLLLELGGKGACVVFDDADIGKAVQAIASTWGFHSGQICTAPTRVIAQHGIYDKLVETLTGVATMLKVGDPLERDTIVGPLISQVQRDRVEQFVQSGADEARLVVGGERPERPGYFVAPALVADVAPDSFVARNEAFGPVVVVMPFTDDDDAVRKANDSPFGLMSYVFSGDEPRAISVAKRIRSGCVGVNSVQQHQEAPFGGMKMSGIGRDRGVYGLEAYSELQAITY